jgi:integrase
MELLGHSSINITMNTYAHVLDDAKRRLADSYGRPDRAN